MSSTTAVLFLSKRSVSDTRRRIFAATFGFVLIGICVVSQPRTSYGISTDPTISGDSGRHSKRTSGWCTAKKRAMPTSRSKRRTHPWANKQSTLSVLRLQVHQVKGQISAQFVSHDQRSSLAVVADREVLFLLVHTLPTATRDAPVTTNIAAQQEAHTLAHYVPSLAVPLCTSSRA